VQLRVFFLMVLISVSFGAALADVSIQEGRETVTYTVQKSPPPVGFTASLTGQRFPQAQTNKPAPQNCPITLEYTAKIDVSSWGSVAPANQKILYKWMAPEAAGTEFEGKLEGAVNSPAIVRAAVTFMKSVPDYSMRLQLNGIGTPTVLTVNSLPLDCHVRARR
jgi:hypothetical protein